MALTYGFLFGEDTNAAQFSEAFYQLFGDGIARYGAQLSVTINGFTATASTGRAAAHGYWVHNDAPLALALQASGNNTDRTDAVAVRVDYAERRAELLMLTDVKPGEIEKLRTADEYCILLYLIRVRRGATTINPEDVTDVRTNAKYCGTLKPLSEISADVLYIYEFLTSGIDREVERLLKLGDSIVARGDEQVKRLNAAIKDVHGIADVGEVVYSYAQPTPLNEWLLCNGVSVSSRYPLYSVMRTLPKIETVNRRKAWIYAGTPA